MEELPKRYSIESLLRSGVQPFDDLDDEALTALAAGVGRSGPLVVPVVITPDGVLIDGHQRLRAMRIAGRKFIDANDVRIDDRATADTALEWAVRLNVQRRHLTVEQKAAVARKLQAENGWGQRKIAELFGVSQPAVSQWLNPKPETPEPPRPRKLTPVVKDPAAVLNTSHKLAEQITDPELAHWIITYVLDEDREDVAMRWEAIARAATKIAEAVGEAGQGSDEPF